MKDVIVVGGGLAGLINAILLARAGLKVALFEEKEYPFHRVCGEYISNEVLPFLKSHGLYPDVLDPVPISQFRLSSIQGKSLQMPLDLGGFGISRYAYDYWLARQAMSTGVEIIHQRIVAINFKEDCFSLEDKHANSHQAKLVIGAFGKRSLLDKSLHRSFIQKKYPYVGVKYHLRTAEVPSDAIELHNFYKGYCGISKVEQSTFNLCYLTHRDNLRTHGNISDMEESILWKNPFLKRIFKNADMLYDQPKVINEISFEKKEVVNHHILMCGDAAGMITPLCGNGMAMAIHSAGLLSGLILNHWNRDHRLDRAALELRYSREWNALFASRLWAGRSIQKLFGAPIVSEIAVRCARQVPPIARYLMRKTHGEPF